MRIGTAPLLMVLIAVVIGCDDAVVEAPVPERPFTVYGYFNPRSDTQAVRVFAIDDRLEQVSADPIDAQVTSIDLKTGNVWTWRDSVVEISPGDFRHIFWAPFRAKFEEEYRLEIRRSDGEVAWATTRTPPNATVALGDLEVLPGTPIRRQPVRWFNVPLLHDVTVHYRRRIEFSNRTVGRDTISIDYDNAKRRLGDGWEVVVDYRADAEKIRELTRDTDGEARLEGVFITALVADSSWLPPGGKFDPELLIQPGRFSNVSNGYGFIGGGYPDSLSLIPDPEILKRIGLVKNLH